MTLDSGTVLVRAANETTREGIRQSKLLNAALSAHGPARDGAFYLTALTYGHYLWQQGQVARAILKLDRALGAAGAFVDGSFPARDVRCGDGGLAASDEALAVSRSIDNKWGIAFSQMNVGTAHWRRGHFETAIASLQRGIDYAQEAGFSIAVSIAIRTITA